MLRNACIAAGMILPSCQDTGTAIVLGKKGQRVWTSGDDEQALARGVFEAYTFLPAGPRSERVFYVSRAGEANKESRG
jgi:tartrate dehydratase alpha subunit/fumarate hydratase class I-like protein